MGAVLTKGLGADSRACKAILAAADFYGQPTHYRNDLEIDRKVLNSGDPPRVFLWALRDFGTHLVYHETSGRKTESVRQRAAAVQEAFGHRPIRWFFWDGATLTEMPFAKALDAFAKALRGG